MRNNGHLVNLQSQTLQLKALHLMLEELSKTNSQDSQEVLHLIVVLKVKNFCNVSLIE